MPIGSSFRSWQLTTATLATQLALLGLPAPLPTAQAETPAAKSRPAATAPQGKKYQLAPAIDPPTAYRLKAVLEAEGKINPAAKSPVPIQVQAEMVYDERVLVAEAQRRQAVRHYDSAQAEITIAGKTTSRKLDGDRSWIVYSADADRATLFSPTGQLRRDELELIDLPANATELDRVLPTQSVALQESWEIPADAVTRILSIDSIRDGQLIGKLVAIDGDTARIEFTGKLQGSDEGAKTSMDVRGKINVDLKSRSIEWIAVGIGEEREANPTAPALRMQARLRIALEPTEDADDLNDANLASLDVLQQIDSPGSLLLAYVSPTAEFQVIHDRTWHPISESTGPVILRKIEGGRVIAQCNVSELNRLPEGSEMAMEGFQKEIRQTLGKMFNSIAESSTGQTPQGLKYLRVAVTGQVGQIPMHWIYYHLADADGYRWAVVFTCEADQLETFAGQDTALVNSISRAPVEDPQTASQTPPLTR